MNTFDENFYDLLSRALGSNSGEALQGFLDEAIALKYGELQIDGFNFAPDMQLDFTYEQIVRELGLSVMANYYDLDSPAIPTATEGGQVYTGKIPRMKNVEYWNEDKLRKLAITEQRFGAESENVRAAAFRGLFNTIDSLVGSHTNSLTYQRHQMVSKGQFEINNINNPLGVAFPVISAHIPASNIRTLTGADRWWTSVSNGIYSTEGANCDPIRDLQLIVKDARRKGVRGHFEVEDAYLDQVLEHSKVKAAIAAKISLQTPSAVSASNLNVFDRESRIAALGGVIGAPIKAIDSIVAVEKWDNTNKKTVRSQFSAFDENVLVFVPDGSLGEILTVEPLRINGGVYADFYGGRLLITVGADYVKKCQSYSSEMTSLVVPDKPNYMWYIHPYSA